MDWGSQRESAPADATGDATGTDAKLEGNAGWAKGVVAGGDLAGDLDGVTAGAGDEAASSSSINEKRSRCVSLSARPLQPISAIQERRRKEDAR
jgi:hypothetical protein